MSNVVVFIGPTLHDPNGANACATCEASGLVAAIKVGEEVQRYCRRCWPAAHRAELEASNRARLELLRRWQAGDWPLANPGRGMTWHWSVTPGTQWRHFWAWLRHRRGQAAV